MFSKVYLEAQSRTQDLLTLKWALRANGTEVASTWHDEDAPLSGGLQNHLHPFRVQRMQTCETLVVVAPPADEFRPELAILVGLALGSEMNVVWVGKRVPMLESFRSVTYVDSVNCFLSDFASVRNSGQAFSTDQLLAA